MIYALANYRNSYARKWISAGLILADAVLLTFDLTLFLH